MQTTLLGLAVALILALIAALVGPFFIDWNQFRPRFEAEASRILGAEVHVQGDLDARLLPTPTLRLGSVVVGGADDPRRLHADRLYLEFNLGDLMRGEWRASELALSGVAVDFVLDQDGRIDWPMAGLAGLGSLSIDRLTLSGRMALHHAASRSTLALRDIAFSGEVRSAAGLIRGDGNFALDGSRHPFRINASRSADGKATRLRLVVEDRDRALTGDVDGLLAFEARAPRFDGNFGLTRAAGQDGATPWRASGKLKADPLAVQFEPIDLAYGPDAAGVKLTGSGTLQLGSEPSLRLALSAKQFDGDKLPGDAAPNVASWLSAVRSALGKLPRAPLPVHLSLAAEQVMWGGRPINDVAVELSGSGAAWSMERVALRAPGGSQFAIDEARWDDARFTGAVALDSADPELLASWLTGRRDLRVRGLRPLRANARIALGPDEVSIDDITLETDHATVTGRIAHQTKSQGRRVAAAIKADRLDLDEIGEAVRELGLFGGWPDEAELSLDVGRAVSAGQILEPLAFEASYSPDRITLRRLAVGSGNSLKVSGRGDIDRRDVAGALSLQADAPSIAKLADIIAPFSPTFAARLGEVDDAPAEGGLTINLIRPSPGSDRAEFRAALTLQSGAFKVETAAKATPSVAAIRDADLDALARSEIGISATVDAQAGRALLKMLKLDRLIETKNPARLAGSATGRWGSAFKLSAKLTGDDLDAGFDGSAEPWSPDRRVTGQLAVTRAKTAIAPEQPASLTSQLNYAWPRLTLSGIDAVLMGLRLRGKLSVDAGDGLNIDGEAGLDAIDLPRAFFAALGGRGAPDRPFVTDALYGWRGRIAVSAVRGILPGDIEARGLAATIVGDNAATRIENLKARIGDGEIEATMRARPAADGVALDSRLEWRNIEGRLLRHGALALPPGKTAMTMTLATSGRSAEAMVGALAGGGTLSIENAQIAGLNPKAFDAALRAGDGEASLDDVKLAQIVEPVLAQGALGVASARIPFSVTEGRLRFGVAAVEGDGVRALVSGGYDFKAQQADLRADMQSVRHSAAGVRPEIRLFAVGPPTGLHRSVEVTGLSLWLAARRIDQETNRLQTLERGALPAPSGLSPSSQPPAPPPTITAPKESAPGPRSEPAAPIPDGEARRQPRQTVISPPARTQPSAAPLTRESAPALPPPVEVRPPPRPRAPLVLTPQLQ